MFSRIVVLCCLIVLSACNLNSTPPPSTPDTEPITTQITPTVIDVTQETTPPTQTPATQSNPVSPVETASIYPFGDLTNPLFAVASYYNAINLSDYARAYGYWESDPNNATLEQYTAGFADTAHVDVIGRLPGFEGVATGHSYADVPVLITSTHSDGSQESFIGCMLAHLTNIPTGPEQNIFDTDWGLRGDVEQFGRTGLQPTTSTSLIQLETACPNVTGNRISMNVATVDQSTPTNTLVSYLAAISVEAFERADGFWDGGASFTLADFQSRYPNVNPGSLYVNLMSIQEQGAAGSAYVSMQAIVLGVDNSSVVSACYVLRRSNTPEGDNPELDPRWWISNETVVSTSLDNPQWITCP